MRGMRTAQCSVVCMQALDLVSSIISVAAPLLLALWMTGGRLGLGITLCATAMCNYRTGKSRWQPMDLACSHMTPLQCLFHSGT
jgi:hypothetical protein